MKLRKGICFPPPWLWNRSDRVGPMLNYALIRADGRVMGMSYWPALAHEPGGRKLIATDLWMLRKILREDRTPRPEGA